MEIPQYRLHEVIDETHEYDLQLDYTYVPQDDERPPVTKPIRFPEPPRGEVTPNNPNGLTVRDVARYVLSLSGYRQYQGFEKRMLLERLGEDEQ